MERLVSWIVKGLWFLLVGAVCFLVGWLFRGKKARTVNPRRKLVKQPQEEEAKV